MLNTLALVMLLFQATELPAEARAWFEKGEELIGTDRQYSEEQAGYFEKAVQLAPDFAPAHFNLALIYLNRDDPARASGHVERLVELLPGDPRGYQLRAHLRLAAGDPAGAEQDLLRVVELMPDDYRAWEDLVRLYYESDRFEEALEAANPVRKHSPAPVDIQLPIALSLHGLGRLDEAADSYRSYLAAYPDDFTANFNLGFIHRQQGDNEQALNRFLLAEEQRPEDPRVAQELGELFLDLGRLDEARARLERAGDASAVNLSNLGVVARQQGDLEGAERYFQSALKLEPANPHLWGHLGDVQAQLGRRAEALQSYQKALEYDPEDVDSLLNLGSMLANLEELEEARRMLQRATELAPSSGDAAFRLGVVLDRLARLDEAFELYVKALGLGFDEARLHLRLAIHYSRRQEPEPALHHLEEAFKRDAARLVPLVREQMKAIRSDLDAIRYKPAFQELLERYSPGG